MSTIARPLVQSAVNYFSKLRWSTVGRVLSSFILFTIDYYTAEQFYISYILEGSSRAKMFWCEQNMDLWGFVRSNLSKPCSIPMLPFQRQSRHLKMWQGGGNFVGPRYILRRTTWFAKLEALTAATRLALSISHWLVLQAIAIIQCKVWFVNTNHQFIPCGSQLHTVQITFSTTCQMWCWS